MKPQRFLLLGAAGKTGLSYAKLLQSHGHHVLWYDKKPTAHPEDLDEHLLTHIAADALIFSKLQDAFDVLTLTPGVPLSLDFIREAETHGKKVVSEVAYCASYLRDFTIIGVTGTDGKSTTTTLIAQILRSLDKPALECGNFGIPLSEIVLNREKYENTVLVCELSSYQLERPGELSLAIGIFLNLAADHLNRYTDLEEYGRAKWNILRCLNKEGLAIVSKKLLPENSDLWKEHHPLADYAGALSAVNTDTLESQNFSIHEKTVFSKAGETLASLEGCALSGRHNFGNLLFAIEAVSLILEGKIDQSLKTALQKISPLPHRFETIPQTVLPTLHFINDSKATTTQATLTALVNTEPPLFILLGGQGKGERYGALGARLKAMGARALLFGATQHDMAADFRAEGYDAFTQHENLFKAFHAAKRMALQMKPVAGGTILLSPAVTSWDQFSSFEERGDYFRSLVKAL